MIKTVIEKRRKDEYRKRKDSKKKTSVDTFLCKCTIPAWQIKDL